MYKKTQTWSFIFIFVNGKIFNLEIMVQIYHIISLCCVLSNLPYDIDTDKGKADGLHTYINI